MITINEFIEKKCLQETHSTVASWCSKGYIPGVKKEKVNNREMWLIPDHAKVPFTNTRARRAAKIIITILKSCDQNKRPVADVFKIDEVTLQSYIDGLCEEKYIRSYIDEDGIKQYSLMERGRKELKDENLLLRFFDKFFEGLGAGAGEVIATLGLQKVLVSN